MVRRRPPSTVVEVMLELVADETRKMKPDGEKLFMHYEALGRQLIDKYGMKLRATRDVRNVEVGVEPKAGSKAA